MAVVTHGSFDEGPIVLALPPVYEYNVGEETDPIFSAWDRRTGISIFRSQISDGNELIGTEDLLTLPSITSTNTITALNDVVVGDDLLVSGDIIGGGAATIAGNIGAANLSGTNTGDEDLTVLVPYTGATADVDLGTNSLTTEHVYLGTDTFTDTTEAVSKGWVEALVGSGVAMQTSVEDFVANYAALPGSPSDGDRYITSDDSSIWEYETDTWVEYVPVAGYQVWVIADTLTYTFDGLIWRSMVGAINHNDTLNKEGGGSGHWYHLTSAQLGTLPKIDPGTIIAVPSGLAVVTKGISIVNGHQSAYIELTWTANTEDAFGHYIVYYKRTGFSIWAEIKCSINEILIEALVPNVYYDFAVAAVNKGGNVTDMTAVLSVLMAISTEPPVTVTGLVATGAIQAVLLRWTHGTDVDLNTYNIYRNTTNDSATSTKIATFQGNAFMDNGPVVVGTIGLAINTTYYYWLKAVNLSLLESTSYSTVAYATTRNIIASDIVNIAASQVIIQGSTTLASWSSPGVTTIDGDKITTGTVTLTKINFTPTLSNNIIASINANTGGLEFTADCFRFTGATVFTAKVGGTYSSSSDPLQLSRVYIYPSSTTGILVTDVSGGTVFKTEIGGDNVGDVTIGNYASGQGILYDKSDAKTTFRGNIEASSGYISGLLEFGTATATFDGLSSNVAISGNHIWENAYDGDGSTICINYIGFAGTSDHYRSTIIGNGKGEKVVYINQNSTEVTGELSIVSTTKGLIVPRMSATERQNNVSLVVGTIVYDITNKAFYGVHYDSSTGTNRWGALSMRNIE